MIKLEFEQNLSRDDVIIISRDGRKWFVISGSSRLMEERHLNPMPSEDKKTIWNDSRIRCLKLTNYQPANHHVITFFTKISKNMVKSCDIDSKLYHENYP